MANSTHRISLQDGDGRITRYIVPWRVFHAVEILLNPSMEGAPWLKVREKTEFPHFGEPESIDEHFGRPGAPEENR